MFLFPATTLFCSLISGKNNRPFPPWLPFFPSERWPARITFTHLVRPLVGCSPIAAQFLTGTPALSFLPPSLVPFFTQEMLSWFSWTNPTEPTPCLEALTLVVFCHRPPSLLPVEGATCQREYRVFGPPNFALQKAYPACSKL